MMEKYETMLDGHLVKITMTRYRIVLNLPNAPPIYSVPYYSDPSQRELEQKEIA